MTLDEQAEAIARLFHRVYQRHWASDGWDVEVVDWDLLSEGARAALLATFRGLLESGVILPGPAVTEGIEEAG